MKFPFVYLYQHHLTYKKMPTDAFAFLWFEYSLSLEEQKNLRENCPFSFMDIFVADHFIVLETHNENFLSLLFHHYSHDKILRQYQYASLLNQPKVWKKDIKTAIDVFQKEWNTWLLQVHQNIPLTFVYGFRGEYELNKAWEQASWEHLEAIAMPVLNAYKNQKQWHDIHQYVFAHFNASDTQKYFAVIYDAIFHLAYPFDSLYNDEMLALKSIYDDYESKWIAQELEENNISEVLLNDYGNNVWYFLKNKHRNVLPEHIETFPAFIQLAFLTSHKAWEEKILFLWENPILKIQSLLPEIPPQKQSVISIYLRRIAENLCQLTKNFDAINTKPLALATQIMDIALEHPPLTLQTFICASGLHEWAGNSLRCIQITHKGLEQFPNHPILLGNALLGWIHLQDEENALNIIHLLEAQMLELSLETFSIYIYGLTSLQKYAQVITEVSEYYLKNSCLSMEIYANVWISYRYIDANAVVPPQKFLHAFMNAAIQNEIILDNELLWESFIEVCRKYQIYESAVVFLHKVFPKSCFLPNVLFYLSYIYESKDKKIMTMAKNFLWKKMKFTNKDWENQPAAFYFMSLWECFLGNKMEAIEYAAKAKAFGYASWKAMKTDEGLREIHAEKAFLAMFEE